MGKNIKILKNIKATTAEISVKISWTYIIHLIPRVVQILSLRVVGQLLVSAICYFALVYHNSSYVNLLI